MKPEPKTILYLSYNGIQDPVGESQICPYLQAFAKQGYRISLVTFEEDAHAKYRHRVKASLEQNGISWLAFRRKNKEFFMLKIVRLISAFIRFMFWFKPSPHQILHVRGYPAAALGLGLLAFYSFRKTIFDMRGFAIEENAENRGWARHALLFWIGKACEAIFLRSYTDIVVLTEDAGKILKARKVQKRIHVIPCSVDTDLFKPVSENARLETKKKLGLGSMKIFMHAGSLTGWYDMDLLAEIFLKLKNFYPEFFLVVMTQNDPARLIEILDKKGIRDYLIFGCGRKQAALWMAIADLGAVMVKPLKSKRASFAIKFSEFLSVGTPVISTAYNEDVRNFLETYGCGMTTEELNGRESAEVFLGRGVSESSRLKCRQVALDKLSLVNRGIPGYQRIYDFTDNRK